MIYLSGPITPKHGRTIEEHIDAAREVYLRFVRAHIPVYCPHLEAAHPDVQAVPYEDWITYDLAVLEHCSGVLTLPHWEESAGAVREVAHAITLGVPVFHQEEEARKFAYARPDPGKQ